MDSHCPSQPTAHCLASLHCCGWKGNEGIKEPAAVKNPVMPATFYDTLSAKPQKYNSDLQEEDVYHLHLAPNISQKTVSGSQER